MRCLREAALAGLNVKRAVRRASCRLASTTRPEPGGRARNRVQCPGIIRGTRTTDDDHAVDPVRRKRSIQVRLSHHHTFPACVAHVACVERAARVERSCGTPLPRTRRLLAAALAALALAACGSDKVEEVSLATRIDVIEAEAKTRIGPAACLVDSDCRALPMGALACGGPSRFLPYSIRGTDEGVLTRLSADHQRLSAEQVAGAGTGSICIAVVPGVPRCELATLSCKL